MSVKKIGANYILTGTGDILQDYVIFINDAKQIVDLQPLSKVSIHEYEYYRGWIIPGFVNTHCHLELSHMKGLLPTGTGLIPFIGSVVTQRDAEIEAIRQACNQADHAMWEAGIMAVGDISNTNDGANTKRNSKIEYYTFVEAFDLMQDANTNAEFEKSNAILKSTPGRKSMVPHAPYSCTPELLSKINAVNKNVDKVISIHNQETVHENNFFLSKSGALIDFYKSFGLSLDRFEATEQASIYYLLAHLDPNQQYLFVHNTMTNRADFIAAHTALDNLYWATCANANLYIENSLPDYSLFAELNANMTIGTDSLASNWQLSVWDELLTIKRFNSFLSNEMLFAWAGINGAKALKLDDKLGTIEIGKSPGLLHIDSNDTIDHLIRPELRPERIV